MWIAITLAKNWHVQNILPVLVIPIDRLACQSPQVVGKCCGESIGNAATQKKTQPSAGKTNHTGKRNHTAKKQ